MTVTLTTINERGEVQASRQFEDAEEATESLGVLEKMGYVTSERPAILEINGKDYEVRPSGEATAEFETRDNESPHSCASQSCSAQLGQLQFTDPKPMEEVEQELNEWINALGITEGDKVFDRDGPSWSNGFEVVSVTQTRADEYVIGTDDCALQRSEEHECSASTLGSTDWGEKVTVAAENPNYPKYDGVIEVTPIDGNNKEYAYPASRLRPVDVDEEDLR